MGEERNTGRGGGRGKMVELESAVMGMTELPCCGGGLSEYHAVIDCELSRGGQSGIDIIVRAVL